MTAAAPPMVLAEAVHKSFGPLEVLRGIDLVVERGQVMCIVGPSGSGKSTFLRCINHLEKIDAGRLSVDGSLVGYRRQGDRLHELREKEVAQKRSEIGMVFQRFNLFPHMTALGNVMEAPVQVKRESRREVQDRARALLERVGLAGKADAYPNQLSGGQQQRVAIARALMTEPPILLADEPTGNLDTRTSIEVMEIFQRLRIERGITVIVITHEHQIAEYGSRVVSFRDGLVVSDTQNENWRVASMELADLPAATA